MAETPQVHPPCENEWVFVHVILMGWSSHQGPKSVDHRGMLKVASWLVGPRVSRNPSVSNVFCKTRSINRSEIAKRPVGVSQPSLQHIPDEGGVAGCAIAGHVADFCVREQVIPVSSVPGRADPTREGRSRGPFHRP